jgi:hypothetical protein
MADNFKKPGSATLKANCDIPVKYLLSAKLIIVSKRNWRAF